MARRDKDPHIALNATDKTGKAFKSAQENMRNLASSAAILEGPLGKVAGRINALGAALGRMRIGWIAGGVATAAFLVGLKSSLEAGAELEKQMLRLDAVLKATGRDTETSASDLAEFARTLGEVTLTSADQARQAAAALAPFKNIDTSRMREVLTLAQDMSAVFGGDLRTNTIKLARALDNPREGLSGLSRNVLATSTAWRNYTADAFEAGKVTEAQDRVLTAIREKVAGAGTAEAGGLAGALDTLGERWQTVLEAMANTAVLQAAAWAINELSDALAMLRGWLEEDEKAFAKYKEKIEPFTEVLEAMGIGLDHLDPENLDQVNRILKQVELSGADLAEAKPFVELNNEITEAKDLLGRMNIARAGQLKLMGEEHVSIKQLNQQIADQEAKVKALLAAYFKLAEGKKENIALDDILLEKADKFIEKYVKKSQSQVEQAQVAMLELRQGLQKISGEDAVNAANKLKEVEAAYLAFVLRLHDEETQKAQDKIDKAIEVQASKLDRLKKALGSEQTESGFTDVRQFDSIQSKRDQIAEEEALEIEAAQRRFERLEAEGKASNELYGQIEAEKILIHQTAEEKRRQLTEEAEQAKTDAWMSSLGHVENLLGELGKENQDAAMASILLSKGLAIAQVFNNTEVAAMRAMAEAGPYAGPGIAASIRAAGAVSMAAIAATGLAQIGNLTSRSSSASSSRSVTPASTETPLMDTRDRASVILQFNGDVWGWDQYIQDKVISGIKDAVSEKDLIIVTPGSRNAQELVGSI